MPEENEEDEEYGSTSILLNGTNYAVSSTIRDALCALRKTDGARVVWIEGICVPRAESWEKTTTALRAKSINTNVDEVILWAGTDLEVDFMQTHLGDLSQSSVENAYKFARLLSTAKTSDIADMLHNKHSETDLPDWVKLIQILYRPWFRGLLLLRSNFLEELRGITVQCGSGLIPWHIYPEQSSAEASNRPTKSRFPSSGLEG